MLHRARYSANYELEFLFIAAPIATVAAAAVPAAVPQLLFGSVDEFVRNKPRYTYTRRVGTQGTSRWDANWWKNPEAISRLDALWRAWEALRLDGTFGMSIWWRDHADHHTRILMSPDGSFAASRIQNADGEPLPYNSPPVGMFVDVRALDS
ncbi:MAG: DUF4913 domain-containing protein [Microbacteriaceae bacterium]